MEHLTSSGIQAGDKLTKPGFLIAYSRLYRHCRNLAKRGCLLHMAISFYALSLLFGSCRLSGLKSVMQQPALVKVALPPLRKCFDVLDPNIEFQWNKIITEIRRLIHTSDIMVPNLHRNSVSCKYNQRLGPHAGVSHIINSSSSILRYS